MESFDVKHVDEYHLTGISLDMFVQWERRPPSCTDGRGVNRSDARGEARPKPKQTKANEACLEGLVSERCIEPSRPAGSGSHCP